MKRKNSIITLVVMLLLTALLAYTVIFGIGAKKTGAAKNIRTGLDLSGGVSITFEAKEKHPSKEDMDDTVNKLQQRADQYSTEALVYKQGTNRINVEIPGVSDANEILQQLGKPGSLYFTDSDGNKVLEGKDIASAEGVATTNQQTGEHQYLVELSMTKEGTKKFAEATTANVGKQIAIIYDGKTISNPQVKEAITGGKAQIDGMKDITEAKNLASFIRIGSLSLELKELYSNVVGAQLGQTALTTSVKAGIIGLCLVILLMILVFRISGVAAGWALFIFALLDLGAINAFDVTLTLPGIAGVILTIGMAVDANVIINTRIREELAAGAGVKGSIKAGFHKAFSAILDGNITTLIAAAVLGALGTGTIKGFAITLAMGVILSMFTALAVSRILISMFYGLGADRVSFYGKPWRKTGFDFIGKRRIFFAVSIILVVLGPIGLFVQNSTKGSPMNFSLDFVGGTATTVDFGENLSLGDLDEKVEPVVSKVTGDANIQFQKIARSNQVIIKTRALSVSERTELNDSLAKQFKGVEKNNITAENISSTISGEMRSNAIRAVIIAIILILFYIWFRFKDARFGFSAIVALAHDILIIFMFYVWSRFSVGSSFVAVMLTILGYSINDTIVVFDRIRENLNKGYSTMKEIINRSVSETLSRSVLTSLTTFITIFVLFLMGVPSVREFSLPIIIGIIAGTYSSIFIASPLWYVLRTRTGKNRLVEKEEPVSGANPGESKTDMTGGSKEETGQDTNHKNKKKEKKDRRELSSVKPKRGRNRRS